MNLNDRIKVNLAKRKEVGTYRSLTDKSGLIDFCSNDYLGLSRNKALLALVAKSGKENKALGATGSRLISGNSVEIEVLEQQLARFFNAESALLFNSGYTANLAAIATLCRKGDFVLFDELIHASLHDGLALSKANKIAFKHNDLQDLEQWLMYAETQVSEENTIFVLVESLYSMDGDLCDIKAITQLAEKYKANIILDEAHSTGLFEKGAGFAVNNRVEEHVFARIHTFGKGIGYHGAVVVGSSLLRKYLINFARPFIYTTATPQHNISTLKTIFSFLENNDYLIDDLNEKIAYFKFKIAPINSFFIASETPIQSLVIAGNEQVKYLAKVLEETANIYVKAIVSPTVPKGKERLRICIHAFNTKEEIDLLVYTLSQCLKTAPL